MKVQFKSGIDHLTNLRELHISDCPVIERIPVVCGLCCLERITLDGLSKCSYLQVTECAILKAVRGKLDFGYLSPLWISDCPELEELPCFAHLTCMEEIHILRCSKLQKVTFPRTLKNLQLDSCKELKSLSEISELTNLVELIISQCGQLELELHLEAIDSLQIIKFDGCRKLKSLLLKNCQNLKSVLGNFNVERISVGGCHELEELLICDCPGLGCLKLINIESCDKLQNITLPAKVTNLIVQRCRHLSGIAGIDDLSKLTELDITECPEFELLFLAELSCLEKIDINSCEKLSTIILPVSVLKIIVQWCRNLQMIAGIGNLSKLTEPCLSKCPQLEDLTVLFGLNSLESITINACRKLNCLKLADCGISEGSLCDFDVGHLVQLKIWNCLSLPKLTDLCIVECEQLEGLLDLAGSSCLERIAISSCDKLHRLTLPRTLIGLIVRRCRELQMITAIGSLPKLTYLCISECEELERLPDLPGLRDLIIDSCQKMHNVALPTTVTKLTLQRCKNFKTLAEMGYLTKLRELHIIDCPVSVKMPIVCGLSCLESITFDGWSKFSYLHVTDCAILKAVTVNLDMGPLAELWISDCPELEELPGFSDLTCLVAIHILRCSKLQKVTFPRTLKNLQLEACNELKSVSEISHLKNLEELIISGCGQLELELHLEGMNALQRITFDCCGKMIVIDSCEKLQSILLATTLIKLTVHRCRELRMVEAIGNLAKLEQLSISECPELEELLILAGLSCLEMIAIDSCEKLHKIILPNTLVKITVQKLARRSQMLTAIENLTNLEDLSICDSPELKELPCFAKLSHLKMIAINSCGQLEGLPDLAGLSCLERINISSCDKLHSITLPRRIIRLIVHRCRELQWITVIGSLPKLRYLCISEREDLEKLPDLAGLSDLIVDSCQKLNRVALPTTVAKFRLQRCRNLQTVTEMGLLRKLTELHISECPVIEEIPLVFGLSCLERITIDASGKFSYLHVIYCAILKAVTVNLGMGCLAQVWISDCPELEELPGFSDLTCLVAICIFRCRKLQKVTFPRTLKNLRLEACKELKSVSEISHLKNLEELIISACGQLELELHLEGMNALQRITFDCCGKMIVIDSCEKLQSIFLATAFIKLTIHRCRELRMIKGIGILAKLKDLSISECPELDDLPGFTNLSHLINLRVQRSRKFPIFGKLSCLKSIIIESCERLENIDGIEELQALEAIQILCCSNAAIQDCIPKLKRVTSNFIQVVGRASDGAESNLKPRLLSEAYRRHPDLWPSPMAIVIICGLVVVNSYDQYLETSTGKFKLPEGEWVITTVGTRKNYGSLNGQYNILSERGIMKRWCVWSVQVGENWRISHALSTLVGNLHQK